MKANQIEKYFKKDEILSKVLIDLKNLYGDNIFIKGGTSLNKFWNLGNRVSEDIDLVLTNYPEFYEVILNGNSYSKSNRTIKELNKEMKNETRKKITSYKFNDNIKEIKEIEDTNRAFINRVQFALFYNDNDFIKLEIGFLSNPLKTTFLPIKDLKTNKLYQDFKVGDLISNLHDKILIVNRYNVTNEFDPNSTDSRHLYDLYKAITKPKIKEKLLSKESVQDFVDNVYFADLSHHRQKDNLLSVLNTGINFTMNGKWLNNFHTSYQNYTIPLIYDDNIPEQNDIVKEIKQFGFEFNNQLLEYLKENKTRSLIDFKKRLKNYIKETQNQIGGK